MAREIGTASGDAYATAPHYHDGGVVPALLSRNENEGVPPAAAPHHRNNAGTTPPQIIVRTITLSSAAVGRVVVNTVTRGHAALCPPYTGGR